MFSEDTLAQYTPTKPDSQKVMDVHPKMILECAVGVEDPAQIAERYGYYGNQWLQLLAYEPFKKAVEEKKAELAASGYTFRMRANMLANDLLEDVYVDAKKEGTNAHTRLEALKFMAKAGGIDAPVKDEMATGNQFNITINLGSDKSIQITANKSDNSENEQKTVENSDFCLNLDDLDDLDMYIAPVGDDKFAELLAEKGEK